MPDRPAGEVMAVVLDRDEPFFYRPACSVPGCDLPPVVKIAAAWSNGPLAELKNYGLACDQHREPLLAMARQRRHALAVSDDEQVGPVEAVPLRDAATRPGPARPGRPA